MLDARPSGGQDSLDPIETHSHRREAAELAWTIRGSDERLIECDAKSGCRAIPRKRREPVSKQVLIVEDDEDARVVYQNALKARGYTVTAARQGAEGVHLARKLRPNLILLDIRMPVMNGWQALHYLRSYEETRSIPVCAISAYPPEKEELERFGSMDCDWYLMKPISPRDVVAEVESRIGPPTAQAGVFG